MFSSSSMLLVKIPACGGLLGGTTAPLLREGHAIGLCVSFDVKPFFPESKARGAARPLNGCFECEAANEFPKAGAAAWPFGVREKCFVFDGGGPRGVVEWILVLDRRLSGVDGGSEGTLNMTDVVGCSDRVVERTAML